MKKLKLFIGSKHISSWSLRAWLLLKHVGVDFEEIVIPLDRSDTKANIAAVSPSRQVPLLQYDELLIWDSLAIAEYLAEQFPKIHLWPHDPSERAMARSICAEMHAGFVALRRHLPFNLLDKFNDHQIVEDVATDIQRINSIWERCRTLTKKSGPYLFGTFGIADAMFAPVATRFITYNVKLPEIAQHYVSTIMAHPAMQQWYEEARIHA